MFSRYVALQRSLASYLLTKLLTGQLPWGNRSSKSNLQTPFKWLSCYKAEVYTSQSDDGQFRSLYMQEASKVWAVSEPKCHTPNQTPHHDEMGQEENSTQSDVLRAQQHLCSGLEPQDQRWSLEAAILQFLNL